MARRSEQIKPLRGCGVFVGGKSYINLLPSSLKVKNRDLVLTYDWDLGEFIDLPCHVVDTIDTFLNPRNGDKLLAVGEYKPPLKNHKRPKGSCVKYMAIYRKNGQKVKTIFTRMNNIWGAKKCPIN